MIPFPSKDVKRPSKEIMEFGSFNVATASPQSLLPYYQFRNIIYVCPKMLNFTNRGGERARNIAVKIQFMSEEGMKGMKVRLSDSHQRISTFIENFYKAPNLIELIRYNLID